jgi:hypothetical protein
MPVSVIIQIGLWSGSAVCEAKILVRGAAGDTVVCTGFTTQQPTTAKQSQAVDESKEPHVGSSAICDGFRFVVAPEHSLTAT